MAKKTEQVCPIRGTMALLSKKWNLILLKQLNDNGKRRFNELIRGCEGISSRTLSKRLKELEAAGLVGRERFSELPPRVEYSLTWSGQALIACFRHMDSWAKKYG